jgi:class 3 adenylate cyclase/tetratricopeptide (TPR) repeat protein
VERRVVSVLFADLVGHTALSERRDVEEVRELLGRYFDEAQTIVERYGGEVEKFIGDAVMAVWGTPTAREDDAERAVRAALDLVPAVSALGSELDAPSLAARAAVLTGEAAVNLGARGQGMVAGDLVNTASRVQGLAEPGTVLVGEATRRASDAAVSYADFGERTLKGKTEPVRLWRALRVRSGRGGSTSEVLEPPFVGRERELRLLKELFHASADESRAHLVSIVGIAGIGKSRLARELERYLDGVAQSVLWHRGRCLAYGEGVTFWAVAEMIRLRAGIAEADDSESTRAKLRSALERYVDDAGERDWIEPRLAQLLGIDEDGGTPSEVFAGWRLFLERLAEHAPVVLVFEDMQWADAPLLEFLEYLLDWSRGHRLFIVALARPELTERHPRWGSSLRSSATLLLEPLPASAMEELLAGYVPGLPEAVQRQIIERAEGVPLYAVETIRMLLDRDLIEQHDEVFRATGPIGELRVPETLQALVAARIDGLTEQERRLVRNAAVIGKTFSRELLEAVTEIPESRLDDVLDALIRKEILSLDADPRSPERGQYAFVQDLLRQVAYETMARSERRRRHLAAAAYLELTSSDAELEFAEIVAAHYLAALDLDPGAADAGEIGSRACATLVRAAERAASLAATESAKRYYEQALQLTPSPLEAAELHEQAGMAAARSRDTAGARAHLEQAIADFEELGFPQRAARVSAHLAVNVTWAEEHDIERAVADLQPAFEVLAAGEPNPDLAVLAVQSARPLFFSGRRDEAMARNELGLQIGETLLLMDVLADGLDTKGLMLNALGRHQEAEVLLRHSLSLATENDLSDAALRAYGNLAATLCFADRSREALELSDAGVALAQKVGDARREAWLQSWRSATLANLGEWDAALELVSALDEDELWESVIWILVERGQHAEVERLMSGFEFDPNEPQHRFANTLLRSHVLLRSGDIRQALALAEEAWEERREVGMQAVAPVLEIALEAAFDLHDRAKIDALLGELGELSPGDTNPRLRALGARFHAKCAVVDGDPAASTGFTSAARLLREIESPFDLAVVLLEHGTWLTETDRTDEARPLLSEAQAIFERLRAEPWLERLRDLDAALQSTVAD